MPSTGRKRAVCIQANREAFAAILDDASVVTWGCHDCGGDCSSVESQLQDVCAIPKPSIPKSLNPLNPQPLNPLSPKAQ